MCCTGRHPIPFNGNPHRWRKVTPYTVRRMGAYRAIDGTLWWKAAHGCSSPERPTVVILSSDTVPGDRRSSPSPGGSRTIHTSNYANDARNDREGTGRWPRNCVVVRKSWCSLPDRRRDDAQFRRTEVPTCSCRRTMALIRH